MTPIVIHSKTLRHLSICTLSVWAVFLGNFLVNCLWQTQPFLSCHLIINYPASADSTTLTHHS
jgi:hypothetical protein